MGGGDLGGREGASALTDSRSPGRRRRYREPRLEDYGDVRSLTLGGSPGANDSGVGDPRDPLAGRGAPFPPSK